MVHRWFAFARLLNTHLTRSCPAFSGLAHHLGHWTEAAAGGVNPEPATRVEGPALISRAARLLRSYQCTENSFAPSWRTVIGIADKRGSATQPRPDFLGKPPIQHRV